VNVLASLGGRPPQAPGFVEAAAKLRPPVALMGSSNVVGQEPKGVSPVFRG